MSLTSRALDRLKVTTARAICQPAVGRALNRLFQDQFPSRGIIAFTRSPAVSDTTRAMLFWGIFESSERRMVAQHFDGRLDTVELGAGMGVISSHLAKRLAPGRRLVSVEANPGLVPLIEQNVAINAPGTALTVVHGAVDYSGAPEVAFSIGEGSHLTSHVGGSGATVVRAPARTLGRILDDAGIAGRYALVADIGDSMHDILARDAGALARCDLVIAELHTRGADTVDDALAGFRGLGFTLAGRHGGVCVLRREPS